MCYHSPTFIYGLDTILINKVDMEKLEIMYRSELKRMQAFPVHTVSPIVSLTIGIPPAEAVRDLEILALMGQVAMCCTELQDVTSIIKNNLQDYDDTFPGWSGLVRVTAKKYSLPDPETYMETPWTAQSWRKLCDQTISQYSGCMHNTLPLGNHQKTQLK